MRDAVAALVAIAPWVLTLRLATSFTKDRRRRKTERVTLEAGGRSVLAEIPGEERLTLFTEDTNAFHLGDREIPKHTIPHDRWGRGRGSVLPTVVHTVKKVVMYRT